MLRGVTLDPQSQIPLYRQLYEQIKDFVYSGALSHGDRLPPTRELAGQLGLNRTTVAAAYELLEADGLIRGHVGRGSYVEYKLTARAPEPSAISFVSSRPDASQFPIPDLFSCCREVLNGPDAQSVLQLGSPAGYAPLREHLMVSARSEGCATGSDDVVITNGCQQALDLIARVLVRPGDVVAVEDPVYHGLQKVFVRAGARLAGIPAGQDGMDVEHLARVIAAERPKLLVVTPNFQNPTGGTLPLAGRKAVLELARQARATVVENDIYGDLRYTGASLPTLKSLQPEAGVILIRSFSKVAFPGLRVGWLVGPAPLAADLAEARQWCDLHTDQLSQAILWRFSVTGRLHEHIARVREAGAERLRAVVAACERWLPAGSQFTRPQGGLNLWVRLASGLESAALLPAAERGGIDYLPAERFEVSHRDPSALRLSFGGLAPGRIEAGVAILGRVCQEHLERERAGVRVEASPALV